MFQKKLWSALLVLCMILAVLTVNAFAAEDAAERASGSTVVFTVKAEKTAAASPGDTITFSVYISEVNNLGGCLFELNIPDGLTFVEGSSSVPSNLKEEYNFGEAFFMENTLVCVCASNSESNLPANTKLLTFQCTINEEVNSAQTVSLTVVPGDISDGDLNDLPFEIVGATVSVEHYFEDGFCTDCGGYEPAVLNGDVYEISNVGQLYWFAAQVNRGRTSINGKLMADIVVNENVLNEDGTLNGDGSNFRVWAPIGNGSKKYTGTFDGNGETVSELYFNDAEKSYAGLFGYVGFGGKVQNVGVEDSYLSGDCYVGGVVGYNDNYGTINNCYNTGTVNGSKYIGGVVGYKGGGAPLSDCNNSGNVSGSGNNVGGIVGYSYGPTTNCYYLEDCVSIYNGCGTAMTVEQFASGEVAYLLQGDQTEQVWGQLIGAEPYPMLSNEKVYGGNGSYYNSCDHYWDGGSCTEGMNCFICGAVSSYFPGHQWQDATCTTVKTCTVCGLTEGTVREHQYESVVAKPDCSHAGFTTYTCAACGDSYYEDFVAPLGHETYSYSFVDGVHKLTCSLCGVTENMTSTDGKQFKFNTAAPTLSDDIVMNIATTLPAGFGEPYMVVEFNGVTTEINDYTINADNGRYVFAFPGINPQTMGDTFHATLYAMVDGVEVTVTLDYSVMKYINSQLKKTTISAELRTALSDLVMYGQYNQVYEGYKTDALLSSLLDAAATLTPSTFAALGTDFNKMAISGTADSSVDLKGVTLSLGSKLCVWVTVFCADPQNYSVKVTINGKDHIYPVSELPLADGYTDRYVLEFDQIRATQFGEVITVTFLNGEGATVGRTLNYSVYTYIQRNQNTTNENLANLLKAIYNYGESVKKL